MSLQSTYAAIVNVLSTHSRVIKAILIRDMRTRFGRTHFTYLVAIGWPLSHLVGMVVMFTAVDRMLPFGGNSTIFISTGALPYILCLYPARLMGHAITQNAGALSFPIVRTVDLIIAKCILEGLTAFIAGLIFAGGLWALGFDVIPLDIPTALTSFYAAVFFGLSIGTVAMTMKAILKTPGYLTVLLMLVVCYAGSGVYINLLPTTPTMRTLIDFNPIYHLVQWTRSAYFDTHSAVPLDKSYVLRLSCFFLFLGLAGERLFRGKILTQ